MKTPLYQITEGVEAYEQGYRACSETELRPVLRAIDELREQLADALGVREPYDWPELIARARALRQLANGGLSHLAADEKAEP